MVDVTGDSEWNDRDPDVKNMSRGLREHTKEMQECKGENTPMILSRIKQVPEQGIEFSMDSKVSCPFVKGAA